MNQQDRERMQELLLDLISQAKQAELTIGNEPSYHAGHISDMLLRLRKTANDVQFEWFKILSRPW